MTPTDLKKGTVFVCDGHIYQSLDYKQKVLGRGRSQVTVKARRLPDGKLWQHTFRGGESLQAAQLDWRTVHFLYQDAQGCYFMDTQDFSQHHVDIATLQHQLSYMIENQDYQLCLRQGQPLMLEIPKNVWLKVTQANPVVRGDTSSDLTKDVTVSTGLVVKAPAFIKVGDFISVDTSDGSYRERKK